MQNYKYRANSTVMLNSLNIGELIYNTLSNNEDITELVGNKIYPLIANAKKDSSTTASDLMPFIIYQRENLNSNGCKDGYYEDAIDFSIRIVTAKYLDGITIANIVRGIFEGSSITYNNIKTDIITLTNAFEDYNDNYSAFVQTLRFNTKIS